jgi:Ca2+-binding RTX toxin-like protein
MIDPKYDIPGWNYDNGSSEYDYDRNYYSDNNYDDVKVPRNGQLFAKNFFEIREISIDNSAENHKLQFNAFKTYFDANDHAMNSIERQFWGSNFLGHRRIVLYSEDYTLDTVLQQVIEFSATESDDFIKLDDSTWQTIPLVDLQWFSFDASRAYYSGHIKGMGGNDIITATDAYVSEYVASEENGFEYRYVPISSDLYFGGANDGLLGHYLDGGTGNDYIWGGARADLIVGGLQTDIVWGATGDDIIFGGDLLESSTDKDYLFGGSGNDTIFAADGNDVLFGNAHDDLVYGAGGNDLIVGDMSLVPEFRRTPHEEEHTPLNEVSLNIYVDGNEVGYAQVTGDNWVAGLLAYDYEERGYHSELVEGNDTLYGGNGNDTILGLGGNDYLAGEDGDDTLFGGKGHDVLIGGHGNDTFYGEAGNDTYFYNYGDGSDAIHDSEGVNVLNVNGNNQQIKNVINDKEQGVVSIHFLNGQYISFSNISSFGINTAESQNLNINELNQVAIAAVTGGITTTLSGNDSVYGSAVEDTIYGGSGDDTLFGAAGDDVIYGEVGADILEGSSGEDFLYGGDGDDTLIGGYDNDTLIGGLGNDTYLYSSGDGDDVIEDNNGVNKLILSNDLIVHNVRNYGNIKTISFANGNSIVLQNTSFSNLIVEKADGQVINTANLDTVVDVDDEGGTVTTGAGNDTIHASSGDDVIDAGGGNNVVHGGSGSTTIILSGSAEFDLSIISSSIWDAPSASKIGEYASLPKVKANYSANYGVGRSIEYGGGYESSSVDYWLLPDTTVNLALKYPDNLKSIKVVNNLDDVVNDLLGFGVHVGYVIPSSNINSGEIVLGRVGVGSKYGLGSGDDIYISQGGDNTFTSSVGNDIYVDGNGDDLYYDGLGSDTYYLGGGDDKINGYSGDGEGSDTFVMSSGIGKDIIASYESQIRDELFIKGIDIDGISLVIDGEDLIVKELETENTLTFRGFYEDYVYYEDGPNLGVLSRIVFQSGHVLTDADIWENATKYNVVKNGDFYYSFDSYEDIQGYEDDDIIWGSESGDYIYGDGGSDTIYGYGGNDEIYLDYLNYEGKAAEVYAGEGDDYIYYRSGLNKFHYTIGDGVDEYVTEYFGLVDLYLHGFSLSDLNFEIYKNYESYSPSIRVTFDNHEGQIVLHNYPMFSDPWTGLNLIFDDATLVNFEGLNIQPFIWAEMDNFDINKNYRTVISFDDILLNDKYQGDISTVAFEVLTESDNYEVDYVAKTITYQWFDAYGDYEELVYSISDGVYSSTGFISISSIEGYYPASSLDDVLDGGESYDNIRGYGGNDIINGFEGSDSLDGGRGNDTLNGGEGSDELFGGAGDDLLIGGSGDDIYYFMAGHGHDYINTSEAESGDLQIIQLEDILSASLTGSRVDNDLIINTSQTDSIRVKDFFTPGDTIQQLDFIEFVIEYRKLVDTWYADQLASLADVKDTNGNVIVHHDVDGVTTYFAYDSANREVFRINASTGIVTETRYDALGRLTDQIAYTDNLKGQLDFWLHNLANAGQLAPSAGDISGFFAKHYQSQGALNRQLLANSAAHFALDTDQWTSAALPEWTQSAYGDLNDSNYRFKGVIAIGTIESPALQQRIDLSHFNQVQLDSGQINLKIGATFLATADQRARVMIRYYDSNNNLISDVQTLEAYGNGSNWVAPSNWVVTPVSGARSMDILISVINTEMYGTSKGTEREDVAVTTTTPIYFDDLSVHAYLVGGSSELIAPAVDSYVHLAHSGTTIEEQSKVFSFDELLQQSASPEGGVRNITAVSNAQHGSVLIDTAARTVTFTPEADYVGAARFDYTISAASNTYTTSMDITVVASVINGTDDSDLLFPLLGTVAGDEIYGFAGNDVLFGDLGDDTLVGGTGDDFLIGGAGNDVYQFGAEFGKDIIDNLTGALASDIDVVEFTDLTLSRLWFSKVDGDSDTVVDDVRVSVLDGTTNPAHSVTIMDWDTHTNNRIDQFKALDPQNTQLSKTLTDAKVQNLINAMATYSSANGGVIPATFDLHLIGDAALLAAMNTAWS